ncbi:MAG: alpha-beta hydrolase superfamily lysophospholipase [Thermoproteota archaeon]|jgi:alpha-beta hydrolase superfamily lysophospholipase
MIHELKKIKTSDNNELNILIRENGSKKWIICLSNYGDHLDRYKYLLKSVGNDYNILQYDFRGHGSSDGNLKEISDLHIFSKDLNDILLYLKNNYRLEDYFLVGHGFGGTVCCDFIQNFAKKELYPSKVFLISPLLFFSGKYGQLVYFTEKYVFSILQKLFLNFSFKKFLNPRKLSHDGRVFQSYIRDTKIKNKVTTHFMFGLIKLVKTITARPLRAECELYCALGKNDPHINVKLTQQYFKQFEKGANLLIVKEAYHELHHEVEKYRNEFDRFFKSALF